MRKNMKRMKPEGNRTGVTHKVSLGEKPDQPVDPAASDACRRVDFYITLNRYVDGSPCEVFAKASGEYQGWCDAVCRLISLLLQNGVEMDLICNQLRYAHFSPFGRVPGFGFARSFVDYLAWWMKENGELRAEDGVLAE